jgi:lysophospholipase L1-like esterase
VTETQRTGTLQADPKGCVGRTAQIAIIMLVIVSVAAILAPRRASDALEFNAPVGRADRFFDSGYTLFEQDAIEAIAADYDAFITSGHWQVSEWTGLTNREFSSTYLNFDANGVRHTTAPDPAYADKDPLLIWAFGGSIMLGWGMSDDYTLPSQLQIALQRQLPDYQVQVVNYGVPFYQSSHEASLFLSQLNSTRSDPDVVIFMDGFNDISFKVLHDGLRPVYNEIHSAWEAWINRSVDDSGWIQFSEDSPPMRLRDQLVGRIPQIDLDEQPQAEVDESAQHDQRILATWNAIGDYMDGQRALVAVGEQADIDMYFFIEPMVNPLWADESGISNFYLGMFRDEVVNASDPAHLFDLSQMFYNPPRDYPLQVDNFHYSDAATIDLAEEIAAIIVPRFDLHE